MSTDDIVTDEPGFDRIMQANLALVFGEADPGRRLQAIRDLYAADAVLYEPGSEVKGQGAISEAVASLLATLPPGFAFRATGPAVGHHGVGRLRWTSGPANGPAVITGTDVARIEYGKIQTLHVFIDPATP